MKAKKSLGQNFLIDPNLQRKIVDAVGAGPEDTVLEVGPGRGALTAHLVGTVGRLLLVELDDELASALRERWGDRDDVVVLHRDILEVDVGALTEEPGQLLVVGNIPYNITTPILFHLLERPRPRAIVLMVQEEVADRILADAGTSAYGALAVGVRSVADVELVTRVPRHVFRPVPRVDSAVVRIVPRVPYPLEASEEDRLRVLTRAAFQWRRKQFQKILRDHPDLDLGREGVEALEARTGVDFRRRPETFSPDELVRLSRTLPPLPGSGGV